MKNGRVSSLVPIVAAAAKAATMAARRRRKSKMERPLLYPPEPLVVWSLVTPIRGALPFIAELDSAGTSMVVDSFFIFSLTCFLRL